jgi:hypothetical protein
MDQLKQKMAGKFYNTCVEGGKWRENPKSSGSAEAKKWREILRHVASRGEDGGKIWNHMVQLKQEMAETEYGWLCLA